MNSLVGNTSYQCLLNAAIAAERPTAPVTPPPRNEENVKTIIR
jgi:hypothetical protein